LKTYFQDFFPKKLFLQRSRLEHHLNYDQMMYWQKRLKHVKPTAFVPVKIKREQIVLNDQCICTLTLPSGHILKIHDEKALLTLLERWKNKIYAIFI
jgi:hypothetical protein